MEPPDPDSAKDASLAENGCLLCKGTSPSLEKVFSGNHACFPCKGTNPSIAERRGSNPPPHMMLPSVDEAPQVPKQLGRSWSFSLIDLEESVMKDVDCNRREKEDFYDAEMLDTGNELHSQIEDRDYDTFCLPSSDTTSSDTFLNSRICR